jgi:hypothetical protein
MHLNPYGEYAVVFAASLANDWPPDREAIVARAREHGMTAAFPESDGDHPLVRTVVDEWLGIVDEPDPHARTLAEVLRAVFSVGTALHLTTRGMHRLGRCEAGATPGDPCRNVVVDVTRNGRQRYCSVRCANRAAVRRHRARSSDRS